MRRSGVLAVTALAALLGGCSSGGGSSGLGSAGTGSAVTSAPTSTTTAPPATLDNPTAVANALTQVERGLRQPGNPSAPALGRVQQLAYGTFGAHPDWRAAVMAAVPADIKDAVNANVDAGVALEGLNGTGPAAATIPAWTIRTPTPGAQLLVDYHQAEAATGVPWAYLAAIHLIESRMGRIQGGSGAGAQGPMQFLPSTFAQYGQGGNINDDHDAILAAGRFLAARGGAANIAKAVFGYNNDQRYVRAVQDYANVMLAAPTAYDGYYQWQVFYKTATGTFMLPEGYPGKPAVQEAG